VQKVPLALRGSAKKFAVSIQKTVILVATSLDGAKKTTGPERGLHWRAGIDAARMPWKKRVVPTGHPSPASARHFAPFATSTRRRVLSLAERDSPLGEIIGRKLHFHSIPWNDADEILSHAAGDMRRHGVATFDLHTKSRVRQRLLHYAIDLQRFFFLFLRHRLLQ
jgi:hypothetical protein